MTPVAPFESSMIVRSAAAGGFLRIDSSFRRRTGLTAADLGGRSLLDWIHAEDRAPLEAALVVGEGQVVARHGTVDGGWVQVSWSVRGDAGEPVVLGRLDGPEGVAEREARPVSGTHLTMADMLEEMARIVEAKNPGLRCSILLVDPDRARVTVGAGPSLPDEYNARVEGLHVGPTVGSCGTAVYWNQPVVVEDIASDPLWSELREVAEIAGVRACWSQPITAMNGEVLGAMALYDTRPGAPTGSQMDGLAIAARMVGLAVERNRLEAQLYQAAKMEALGVLAGGIAHDFNNLLAAIMGNAELAMGSLAQGSESRAMLDEIVTASVNAADLCNQMLAYAGRGARSPEILDCNALVRELAGLLQVALSKKAVLDLRLSDAPLSVLADRSQLRQVVMNLITNASEAIGDREGRITITTELRSYTREELELRYPDQPPVAGDYVRLRVSDTGVGMTAKTQARIFDPFFTTKPNGRGLGLAAVKGIVLGHSGAITLDSRPGAGTSFTVLLPYTAAGQGSESPSPSVGGAPRPAHVLVVDDEDRVRTVYARMLERAGYRVTRARDGLEALDVYRREGHSIECVLLDLSMPKLDGQEVFRELRRIDGDVRVILISGFTEQEIMDRFRGGGLSGAVQKPVHSHVLLARVAQALSGDAVPHTVSPLSGAQGGPAGPAA